MLGLPFRFDLSPSPLDKTSPRWDAMGGREEACEVRALPVSCGDTTEVVGVCGECLIRKRGGRPLFYTSRT
jgi:hypothetical protein